MSLRCLLAGPPLLLLCLLARAAAPPPVGLDQPGDPLPRGATARLGTTSRPARPAGGLSTGASVS